MQVANNTMMRRYNFLVIFAISKCQKHYNSMSFYGIYKYTNNMLVAPDVMFVPASTNPAMLIK